MSAAKGDLTADGIKIQGLSPANQYPGSLVLSRSCSRRVAACSQPVRSQDAVLVWMPGAAQRTSMELLTLVALSGRRSWGDGELQGGIHFLGYVHGRVQSSSILQRVWRTKRLSCPDLHCGSES